MIKAKVKNTIRKENDTKRQRARGMSVVEAVVAVSIFGVVATIAMNAYLYANNASERAANSSKAWWLAEEGIEASRSIRDQSFSMLTPGTHGLSQSGNKWSYNGTADYTDGYMRTIALTSLDADHVQATSSVSWNTQGATSTVSLAEQFTNWRKSIGTEVAYTSIATSSATLTKGNAELTGLSFSTTGDIATTTITAFRVSWSGGSGGKITLKNIYSPNTTTVFGPGAVDSGATTTLSKSIVLSGAATQSFQILFSGNIKGYTITIAPIFDDGSSESVSLSE